MKKFDENFTSDHPLFVKIKINFILKNLFFSLINKVTKNISTNAILDNL